MLTIVNHLRLLAYPAHVAFTELWNVAFIFIGTSLMFIIFACIFDMSSTSSMIVSKAVPQGRNHSHVLNFNEHKQPVAFSLLRLRYRVPASQS